MTCGGQVMNNAVFYPSEPSLVHIFADPGGMKGMMAWVGNPNQEPQLNCTLGSASRQNMIPLLASPANHHPGKE